LVEKEKRKKIGIGSSLKEKGDLSQKSLIFENELSLAFEKRKTLFGCQKQVLT
jgi:hypothetical protein